MPAVSRKQVASLLHERRRALGPARFKPENYGEISRVLGARFIAPDINRVASMRRQDAASAYLRRLHHDVDRARRGYYLGVQAMPLQIKSLAAKKDEKAFKSLLIPGRKLTPLGGVKKGGVREGGAKEATPSPKSLSPVPPLVLGSGSTYVPHKYFSPHSHTHIHVLFKQMPGSSLTPRKAGAGSVVSEKSGNAAGSSGESTTTTTKISTKLPVNYRHSPRGSISKVVEESEKEPAWPGGEAAALPYSHRKFEPRPAVIPHTKKRLQPPSPRLGGPSSADKTSPMPTPRRSLADPDLASPVSQFIKDAVREAQLPPKVAAALVREGPPLYRLDFPAGLAASVSKEKVLAPRRAHPLPAIPRRPLVDNELLAIVSVQSSNTVQVAA